MNDACRALRQLPPPLTRSVQDPLLPHAAVLDELLSPVGVLLWQLLQDATLWSTAERSMRGGLFADAARATAGVVPEVEEELDALGVLVRDPHPDAGPIIARMCDRVRTWAEGRGLNGTALAFAQAASLADPEDARGAYEVGRLARRRAEYARAEVWYQRAAVLGARAGDRLIQVRSISGLANLSAQRGNYATALRLKEKAVRIAHRHSLREALGINCHGLAVLQFETGDIARGMQNIRRALQVLGAGHDQIPFIAHDTAVALMDQLGAFAAAAEVLHAILPRLARMGERLLVLTNLARAAGALGRVQLFDAVWTEVWPVAGTTGSVVETDALIALSRGAASLQQWSRARQAAEHALALAQERREGKSIFLAEVLLSACEGGQQTPEVLERIQPVPPADVSADVHAMARDLVQALLARAPAADTLLEKLCAVLDHPHDAMRAYDLGRALRLAAEYDRAEAWLEHGIEVARTGGNPTAEACCLAALGNLHAARGDLARALDIHQQRLELAQRAGLREMEGDAMVDLCATSFV
ncbi:MAG TPA: tetratricopeptide repeat protein, partial [Longimicrobiaceae bacterium]|nr:tetratricopeptide repeat protein [Longimicrobiaceae bacterium]